MCQQIKILMADKHLGKLTGTVQVDESYFGMKLANMHAKKRKEIYDAGDNKHGNKTGIMGFINEEKKLRFEVMTDTKSFKQSSKGYADRKSLLVIDRHLG